MLIAERRKSEIIGGSKTPVRELTVAELEAVAGGGEPTTAPRPSAPNCGCQQDTVGAGAAGLGAAAAGGGA
jgi:hypothetical protein